MTTLGLLWWLIAVAAAQLLGGYPRSRGAGRKISGGGASHRLRAPVSSRSWVSPRSRPCRLALGGWTSSNYAAALACLDFPTCPGARGGRTGIITTPSCCGAVSTSTMRGGLLDKPGARPPFISRTGLGALLAAVATDARRHCSCCGAAACSGHAIFRRPWALLGALGLQLLIGIFHGAQGIFRCGSPRAAHRRRRAWLLLATAGAAAIPEHPIEPLAAAPHCDLLGCAFPWRRHRNMHP